MSDRKYIPIQIIGTQRSGSNLLRLMLNELEDVVAPHPPHILKILMPLISKYPDLSENKNFGQLVEDVCMLIETNPVSWENIELDRAKVFNLCKKRSLIELFRVVYEMMAEANNATYWCCKSMVNVKYTDQMEKNGIKPFYIHLLRDGRDVAASFKKVAVGDKHIYSLSNNWSSVQELSSEITKKAGKKRAITVRYEDLITEPEITVNSICDFLGVTYNPKVLNYFDSDESRHTAEAGFMWVNLTKPIMKDNIKKYKNALSKNEIEIFESIAGNTLTKFGYELETRPNVVDLSPDSIAQFEKENDRLIKEIELKDYLKTDIVKRSNQVEYINSIEKRLLYKN